jgi:hypothetical protein
MKGVSISVGGMAGIAGLARELDELSGNMRTAIGLAIRRGGRVVRQAAERSAPDETRVLLRSLAIRTRSYRVGLVPGASSMVAIVGPRQAFSATVMRPKKIRDRRTGVVRIFSVRQNAIPSNYVHLVAFGARPHALDRRIPVGLRPQRIARGGGGQHPGFAGRNFMQEAAERTQDQAARVMRETLVEAIDKTKQVRYQEFVAGSLRMVPVSRPPALPPLPLVDRLD